jgi:hypothetical protein
MTTATVERTEERQDMYRAIEQLSDIALEKLADYIDFLRYEDRMEELEEEEDIAYLKTLTPEDYANAVPFEEVIKEFEAQHGPLDQD